MFDVIICHNPYFNRWFSAIHIHGKNGVKHVSVTILILIDGFLQCREYRILRLNWCCHNPYFNRWFSAINTNETS